MMRTLAIAVVAIALLGTATGQERPALDTDRAKLSYALGMDLGKQLRDKQVDVDPSFFERGLADALSGRTLLLADEDARRLVSTLQGELQRREFARVVQEAERNRREGETFLDANKAKEGVVTRASGLQYRVLTAGTGPRPTAQDVVMCRYRGTFIDGTEFDSSHGKPAAFPVNSVISGWSEALQLMATGSRWQLVVPPALAYGSRGAGGRIPPNATLVYEVELVAIK